MIATFNQMEQCEMELLGILSNFPELIDKLNFSEDYFSVDIHKKFFRYLKQFKEMNCEKMLLVMNLDEVEYCVSQIFITNAYDKGAESMSNGFANMILEHYKAEEISNLEDKRKFGMINSDTYYFELTKLVSLTTETNVDVLTNEIIDEMVSNESNGIRIKRFEYLSSYLKVELTDIITVAGVSGFGKSAFLLNLFQSLSQDNQNLYKCHYFNIEVAPRSMVKRLLAITSNHTVDEFNKANINKDFYQDAKAKIQNDSYINSGSISIDELKAKALNNLDKDKINVLFVDHIGLIDVADKNYNRSEYDRVTYCMKELRKLALDNNLIIFIASQFDRNSVRDNKLSMHSLKSSGEIENSSTHVLLLKESETEISSDKKAYEEIMIDIVKNRNGPIAKLDFYTFTKSKQTFTESKR